MVSRSNRLRKFAAVLVVATSSMASRIGSDAATVTVEVEEDVYSYTPANNGAGPMWCAGSTCLVRVGEVVFATGLETLPDAKPLNNCRWVLWRRDEAGWRRFFVDAGRTREPSPIAVWDDGSVFVSANPTLTPPEREGGGPALPEILRFDGRKAEASVERWSPKWSGTPRFTEHSYRSFAADPVGRGLILFQNIDYTHAEWTFHDAGEGWAGQGQLKWPWGADYAKPQPIRVCYPNVALMGRAVHFLGVSDILEPNPAWRAYKKELTGRDWDYDFRRLFYTWTPDVTREPFREWKEVASREATGGGISPADLWVAPDGAVHALWMERAIDERLRPRFFPEARQSHALRYAVFREGRTTVRTLFESTEDRPGPVCSAARFAPMPNGRLMVVGQVGEGGRSGLELFEMERDGGMGPRFAVPLRHSFGGFFTATPRAGSKVSEVIDLLGPRVGLPDRIGYARLRVASKPE